MVKIKPILGLAIIIAVAVLIIFFAMKFHYEYLFRLEITVFILLHIPNGLETFLINDALNNMNQFNKIQGLAVIVLIFGGSIFLITLIIIRIKNYLRNSRKIPVTEITAQPDEDELNEWILSLETSDNLLREEAIISLGQIGDKKALPYLEKLLNDDSKSIRELSKKAIKEIKNKSAG